MNIPLNRGSHATDLEIKKDSKIALQIEQIFSNLGISQLMQDPNITEIAINEPNKIFFERDSQWGYLDVPNNNSDEIIEGLGILLINHSGQEQKFDANNPMLSLTMPNGERAQLVRKPSAEHASLTVRIPSKRTFSLDEYKNSGLFAQIIPQTALISEDDNLLLGLLNEGKYQEFCVEAVRKHKNIVVSGATGSGKTTFMKTLLGLIPDSERIITIEDARELFIDHPNKVHLLYPKSASASSVSAKTCLEATLRMKPDRIILAEVRGDEAFYFIRACGNGHSGSITSCHADSALMAYEQLALMINASPEGASLSYDVIKRLIMMTIDVSIHFANQGGKRFITGIDFDPVRKIKLLRGE